MENYAAVVHQMQAFGVVFRDKDLPLVIDAPKRRGCGLKGKWWYWLRSFRPDAGGTFIVGRFGSYKSGESEKVEVDWQPLNAAEAKRRQAEQDAAQAVAAAARQAEADLAALSAADLWRMASKQGSSPYLARKGVVGEACRYLPNGELLVPLLRYDWPRDQALRAVQRIKPDGAEFFTKGFAKPGCSVRLGEAQPGFVILVCEGYATGLTLRMATGHTLAVYVALDAGNLQYVVPLVRALHPTCRILICADDDFRTRDHAGVLNNPGRTAALKVAKTVVGCDLLVPIFPLVGRGPKDTDFNDLHQSQGIQAVSRQITSVLRAIRTKYHG
jgi:putative DNA primase/helicase